MTTHRPKICTHTVLQLVGLTTEKLFPTALLLNKKELREVFQNGSHA